jgi:hypothetical protein
MLLTSQRHAANSDVVRFTQTAQERGWGDGLPLVPATVARVEEYVEAAGLPPETVLAQMPPLGGDCTVERLAINAVMAGAPARSMPLLVAAVGAVSERDFQLDGLSATTGPAVPALIVNGPARHDLNISFGAGCVGGADGNNAVIGRALRLVMRNVGGQRIGTNSECVFGQPGRITGVVFGEWEERSPWPPLAQRRGVTGNAVTAFGANGTMNINDHSSDRADMLLDRIGKSLSYPGSHGFRPHAPYCVIVVGINPAWADIIGRKMPDITRVQERIWDSAALPIDTWPAQHQGELRAAGMVTVDGRVHVVKDPDRLLVVVCGGDAGLHGLALHGPASCVPITKGFNNNHSDAAPSPAHA